MSRTFTVGMLVPDLTNPLFPPIVRGLEDRLREAGWTLVLANTDNDDDKERSLLQTMTTRRVDGLILATARRSYPLLAEIERAGCRPCWSTAPPTSRPCRPSSATTTTASARPYGTWPRWATPRSRSSAAPRTVSTGLVRYHSFVSWMHSAGLEADPERIVFARWFREDLGADAFEELIRRGVEFTAAVCGNDLIALGGYTVLRARGLRCPEDVSIVGYNDTPFNDKFSPPLTSLRLPHYQIGHRAADMLIEGIEDPGAPPADIRLKPELMVRGSTAPPRS